MRALFEAQEDFPQIEKMICQMFGIPEDSRMAATGLGHGHVISKESKILHNIDRELEKLGIDISVDDIFAKFTDNEGEQKRYTAQEYFNWLMEANSEASDDGTVPNAMRVAYADEHINLPEHIRYKLSEELGALFGLDTTTEKILSKYGDPNELAISLHPTVGNVVYGLLTAAERIFPIMDELDRAATEKKQADYEEFVNNRGPHDYLPPGGGEGAEIIPTAAYIRIQAMAVMYHTGDATFGYGNSQSARDAIADGDTIKYSENDIHFLKTLDDVTPDNIGRLPTRIKDYVALMSRQFMPGMCRIAFGELGLMGYLYDNFPQITGVLDFLKVEVNDRYSVSALKNFCSNIIPCLVVNLMLAATEPTTLYGKSDMGKGDKLLGPEFKNRFKDIVTPYGIDMDSNLAIDGGSRPLTYNALVSITDSAEPSIGNIVHRTTHNDEGEPYMYSGDTEVKPITDESNTVLKTVHADDTDLPQCPAYKTENGWYVVYVPDRFHSAFGWFAFNEPSAIAHPNGKFFLKGRGMLMNEYDTGGSMMLSEVGSEKRDKRINEKGREVPNEYQKHCGVGHWCIVYYPNYYWGNYMGDNRDYAYYLIHEDALKEDLLHLDMHPDSAKRQADYDTSAYGCAFRGYGPMNGFMMQRDRLISRGDYYTLDDDCVSPYYNYDAKFFPKNMLKDDPHGADLPFNLNMIALNIIGKWDNTLRDPDEIKNKVRELTFKWFPPKDKVTTTEQDNNHSTPSMHIPDVETLAKIMSSSKDAAKPIQEKLRNREMSVNFNDAEYTIIPEMCKNGPDEWLYVFAPVDVEEPTQYTEVMGIYKDSRTGKFIPVSTRPVEMKALDRIIDRITHPKRNVDERPEYAPDTGESKVRWWNTRTASNTKHVGLDEEGNLWIADSSSDRMEKLGPTNLDFLSDHINVPVTFIDTPNGVNILVYARYDHHRNSPFAMVGYARRDRVTFYYVELMTDSGTAILGTLPGISEPYHMGNIAGDFRGTNAGTFQGYLYINGNGEYADHIGLEAEFIQSLYDDGEHRGKIGMGMVNGRYGDNNAANGALGTIRWFDADTLQPAGADTPILPENVLRNQPHLPIYGEL